jgi:hypothetical protein
MLFLYLWEQWLATCQELNCFVERQKQVGMFGEMKLIIVLLFKMVHKIVLN